MSWCSCNPLLLPMGQTGEIEATGKSCQMDNWRAGVEGEKWKAQDENYLSCKVELKHASVHMGTAAWTEQRKETCSHLFEFVLVALLEQQAARQGQQERGDTVKARSKTNPLTS